MAFLCIINIASKISKFPFIHSLCVTMACLTWVVDEFCGVLSYLDGFTNPLIANKPAWHPPNPKTQTHMHGNALNITFQRVNNITTFKDEKNRLRLSFFIAAQIA